MLWEVPDRGEGEHAGWDWREALENAGCQQLQGPMRGGCGELWEKVCHVPQKHLRVLVPGHTGRTWLTAPLGATGSESNPSISLTR